MILLLNFFYHPDGHHQTKLPRKKAGPFQAARGPIVCLLVLSIALSCGPGDLSREDAKSILNADKHFTPAIDISVSAHDEDAQAKCPGYVHELLSNSAQPRFVEEVTGITTDQNKSNQRYVEFTCGWKVTPVSLDSAAELTKILNKKVDAISPALADCLAKVLNEGHSHGKAVFQLYDDGWRVVAATCEGGL